MYEGITPQENREFDSSLGNWTGDIMWEPGPLFGRTGLMKFTKPIGLTDITASLSYPYVKPLQNKRQAITAYLLKLALISAPNPISISITDGVYTFDSGTPIVWPDNTWIALSIDQIFPPDWIVGNTILSINGQGNILIDLNMWWDNFSLYPIGTPKTDHLPLMGVH